MPRQTTLSNPTGLTELDRQRIGIVLDDKRAQKQFSLVRLEVSDLRLPPNLNVVVIARRGPSEERFNLGTVADWDRSFQDISELGDDGTWGFRVLLVQPGSPRLVAAAENIRPIGQGDSESFIALEPADLGELVWEVDVLEQDGRAVIRFNKDVYQSPGEAEADRHFTALVLPEAMRRLANWHAEMGAALEDPIWEPFKSWLEMHGVVEPPEEDWERERKEEWAGSVVHAFCERFKFASMLNETRNKGGEE